MHFGRSFRAVGFLTGTTGRHAIVLTIFTWLMCLVALSSCSTLHPPKAATAASYDMKCKNHAYVRMVLQDFLSTRFHSQAPARLAVIPFSVPANVSAYDSQRPGLGNQLAWSIRSELIRYEAAPIVEVLNRYDWPGKREEFFTGNHGALTAAREAGYDLVLVGAFELLHSLDEASVYTKLIEVDSGITVWNGRSSVIRNESLWHKTRDWLDLQARVPAGMQINPLIKELVSCTVRGITDDRPVT